MIDFFQSLTIHDAIGLLGSLLLCFGYLTISGGWVKSDSSKYHAINLIGACLLLWSLWFRPNYGAILIEIIWAGIAACSLTRLAVRRRQPASTNQTR